jgi:hypothetical protein
MQGLSFKGLSLRRNEKMEVVIADGESVNIKFRTAKTKMAEINHKYSQTIIAKVKNGKFVIETCGAENLQIDGLCNKLYSKLYEETED